MEHRTVTPDPPFTTPRQSGPGLRQALTSHCASSDALYTALLEENGNLYADAGDESMRQREETAVLAAAVCEAARQLTRHLGESAFEGMFHEGARPSFYLSPVDGRFLLLSVFGNETKLALVRASALRTAVSLRDFLTGEAAPDLPMPAVFRRSSADGDLRENQEYFLPAS